MSDTQNVVLPGPPSISATWQSGITYTTTWPTAARCLDAVRAKQPPPIKRRWKRTYPKLGN